MRNIEEGAKLSKKQLRKENRDKKVAAFVKVALANQEDRRQHIATNKRALPNSTDSDTLSEENAPARTAKIGKYDIQEDCNDGSTGVESKPVPWATVNREKNTTMLDIFLRNNENLQKRQRDAIELKKIILQQPKLGVLQRGFEAQLILDGSACRRPLLTLDIITFLVKLVNPIYTVNMIKRFPLWYKIDKPAKITSIVVVVAEGISARDFQRSLDSMPRTRSRFKIMVEVKPNKRQSLVQSVLSLTSDYVNEAVLENEKKLATATEDVSVREKCERTKLLLSIDQMEQERYPLIKECQSGYVCTKEEYLEVTNSSPLFGIDCEMCRTAKGNELTRVAVVNENLDLLYDEFVKPDNRIIDYLTRYSGITPAHLAGVKTRLKDVQKQIGELLPPDAILCGHSLNSDLHALKMVHPYNIDTSVIFRRSWGKRFKSSLKYFTKLYLNRDIQLGVKGHNPIEDGAATLQLVQLKLQNGLDFGDASMNRDFESCDEDKFFTELKVYKRLKGFLESMRKKVKVITSDASMTSGNSDASTTLIVASNKEVIQETCTQIAHNDFTIAHLRVRQCDQEIPVSSAAYNKLDKRLEKTFESCPNGAIVLVIFDNSSATYLSKKENSLFLAAIKPPQ